MSTISEQVSRPSYEQRVILHNVGWETYEKLLADLVSQSSVRLTYDRGTLEIMSPLSEHERINRTIALLIEILAEEMNIDVEDFGSTTFKREDLARGFEPDSCFYIQNEEKVKGKDNIDLNSDPPPDLVIEVDITSSSLDKFSIYARIVVPEVWHHDGRMLKIYKLVGKEYIESNNSLAFPLIESADISDFIEKSKTLKRTAFTKLCREWIRNKQTK